MGGRFAPQNGRCETHLRPPAGANCILFRILNFAGYCSEKSEQTSISGTHDVSHAIYATKADFLVTMDRKFAKKCKAVYNFLGVRTSVIFCKQNEVVNVLENIVTESDVI